MIYGSYIASGIAGIFFFHMAENIGMTIGLLPITGVPLPFVSYRRKLINNKFYIIRFINEYKWKKTKGNIRRIRSIYVFA